MKNLPFCAFIVMIAALAFNTSFASPLTDRGNELSHMCGKIITLNQMELAGVSMNMKMPDHKFAPAAYKVVCTKPDTIELQSKAMAMISSEQPPKKIILKQVGNQWQMMP